MGFRGAAAVKRPMHAGKQREAGRGCLIRVNLLKVLKVLTLGMLSTLSKLTSSRTVISRPLQSQLTALNPGDSSRTAAAIPSSTFFSTAFFRASSSLNEALATRLCSQYGSSGSKGFRKTAKTM